MVFTFDEKFDAVAKMKVVGVGGAGGNAVNRMITEGLSGVEFISINTDAMALDNNLAKSKIQIGERITKGLGAGANPEIGRIALEEDRDRVVAALEGADMVFITAGMGGGTGTGGAPAIAEITRELDILTVAIVTRPFLFEGKIRDRNARKGIEELRRSVDTIIVIPNQKLLSIVDRNTSLLDAFKTADEVLHHATKGISDLISVHGLVNLDFADVRTIMKGMGDAIMGSGLSEGENRAVIAADAAIHSPMLDDISINGAKGILINITGGEDLTLYDVGDATQTIYDAVGEDNEANIIFGAVTNPQMNGKIQVTVIATGFNETAIPKESNTAKKSMTPLVFDKPKQSEEKRVEQMSFELDAKKSEHAPAHMRVFEKDEGKETKKLKVIDTLDDLRTESAEVELVCEPDEDTADAGKSKSVDIPVVVKTGNFQKEQIFVSKGQVISHYEDDMDVPTFLRKQMQ
ncbi:MAG: cell division protein FtsZ [Spirochaetales bacterium]|nr:MAG: cell division protein FtsZ [Spirochaetales bacterium]